MRIVSLKKTLKAFGFTTALTASFMGAAQAEDLKEALAKAYSSNPDLLAQRTAVRAADENVSQATSAFMPRASLSGTLTRQNSDATSTSEAGTQTSTTDSTNKSYGARVDQSLFRGFQDYNYRQQSAVLVKANRAQLTLVEQNILLSTVAAYMNVVRDEAVLNLNSNQVEVLRRQLQASQDRFRVGEITRTDVAQSEARLAGAEANKIRAEATLAASRAEYKRIVGDTPGSLEEPAALPALPGSMDEALSIALEDSPTVKIAKFNAEAANYGVQRSMGGMLPTVNAYANYNKFDGTNSFGALTAKVDQTSKSVGLSVSIPLYQGGAEYSAIRQAKHFENQRRIEITSAERTVRSNLRSAWEQYRAAVSSIASTNSQVEANQIALEGVRQEAAVGSRTTLDVLDAEQELLDSRVNLVRARRDEYVAAYTLLASTGRLTAKSLSLNVELYDPQDNYDDVSFKPFGWGVNK